MHQLANLLISEPRRLSKFCEYLNINLASWMLCEMLQRASFETGPSGQCSGVAWSHMPEIAVSHFCVVISSLNTLVFRIIKSMNFVNCLTKILIRIKINVLIMVFKPVMLTETVNWRSITIFMMTTPYEIMFAWANKKSLRRYCHSSLTETFVHVLMIFFRKNSLKPFQYSTCLAIRSSNVTIIPYRCLKVFDLCKYWGGGRGGGVISKCYGHVTPKLVSSKLYDILL